MASSVAIVGCGWLGQALAKDLVKEQIEVVATTQSPEKLAMLAKLGVQAKLFSLPLLQEPDQQDLVFNCHTLVIAIPPMIRQGKQDYADKIAQLVNGAERGNVSKIILISTTAVYDGYSGRVTEELPLKRELAKVDLLARAEQQVLGFSGVSVVLRCAGLVGEDRHPGRFFANNRVLKAPGASVNLVHQVDVVAILRLFIETEHSGIFNAVGDTNITKKQFYQAAAQALNLPLPTFEINSKDDSSRKVVGDKLIKLLNYQYRYGDLVSWLSK
ncbi:NAD(P)-dependent oxidoreductase [Thalassotalea insulae]|uniref:NAD(P)-dependent oxidoreductase n=1 Tax=Thalassotalea insulae TaxID=2056778 RepID=A0ABQ6GV86_9GAMM|nr:NAD(P)H-binding protein [Thalassotalea insulae]GLX78081.1 NAD(P)-dependent oxidoreductase [Thalassotalea insulae]